MKLQITPPPVPICIDLEQLSDPQTDLAAVIEEAFGPGGLGLLTVKNVPKFPELRRALLPLAVRLAQLPDNVKTSLEDPLSRYNFGYSCGKETLEPGSGSPDTRKSSFFANPLCDAPSQDPRLLAEHPEYCRPNIWPNEALPQLEEAFKSLGKVMYDVGLILTGRCNDVFRKKGIKEGPPLQDVLARSQSHKGRLLCYLPPPAAIAANENGPSTNSTGTTASGSILKTGSMQWCAWHTDHGCLTALTSALYTDSDGNEIECRDPESGLYVRNRAGEMVRIVIPADYIAFQLGEVFQILSGGALQATPHCVMAPSPEFEKGVYRNTFALFMQPKWDEQLKSPPGKNEKEVGVNGWKEGMDFGEFSEKRFAAYYSGTAP